MPQIPSPHPTVQDDLFQAFLEDRPPSTTTVIALAQRMAQLSHPHAVMLWDDLVEKRTLHPWAGESMADLAKAWATADPQRATAVVNDPAFVAVLGSVCVKGLVPLMTAFLHAGAPRVTRHRMALPVQPRRTTAPSDGGWTLLHLAAWCGDPAMVDRLLDEGADATVPSDGGITPLHAALMVPRSRTATVVRQLLNAGAMASVDRPAPVLRHRTPPGLAKDHLTDGAWVLALQRWEQDRLHQAMDGTDVHAARTTSTPVGRARL